MFLFQNVDGSFFSHSYLFQNGTDDNRHNRKAIFIRLDDLKVKKKEMKLEMAGKKRERNFKVNLLFFNLYCCCLVDYVYIKILKYIFGMTLIMSLFPYNFRIVSFYLHFLCERKESSKSQVWDHDSWYNDHHDYDKNLIETCCLKMEKIVSFTPTCSDACRHRMSRIKLFKSQKPIVLL